MNRLLILKSELRTHNKMNRSQEGYVRCEHGVFGGNLPDSSKNTFAKGA